MNIPLDTLVSAGAGIFGSITAFMGVRLMSRTENRKVKNSEFRLIMDGYNERIKELEKRYAEQDQKLNKVENLLRQALRYIVNLRADMRTQGVHPTHAAPAELESLLWTYDPATSPQGPSGPPQGE